MAQGVGASNIGCAGTPASMTGLTPSGLITFFVMTTHANRGAFPGVADRGRSARRRVLLAAAYTPDQLADDALAAIVANKALLVAPRQARMAWRFARLSKAGMQRMATGFVAQQRREQRLDETV